MWIWIWLAVCVGSLIFEFVTMEMFSIWFAIGGIIALILAACNVTPLFQIIVFVIVSLIFLLSFRKLALKFLFKNDKELKTNKDGLVGKSCILIDPIGFNKEGSVKINGVSWTVISINEKEEIPAGEHVTVVEAKGSKLVVEKNKKEEK